MNLFRTMIRVEFGAHNPCPWFLTETGFSDTLSPFPTNRIEKIWAMSS